MNRIRQGLEILLGLLLGLLGGLAITWWIAPNTEIDNTPAALHDDYKDEYRLLVATTYTETQDLGRARSRLSFLNDNNIIQSLIEQALRFQNGQDHSILFPDNPEKNVYALALLANDLEQRNPEPDTNQTGTFVPTEVRPTNTPKPYELISQEILCNPETSIYLTKIVVRNHFGTQQPGVEILVTWEDGQESIFTGLKPGLGDGYADFIMEQGISYSLQLLPSSVPINNLTAPECTMEDGRIYYGGYLLQFQLP